MSPWPVMAKLLVFVSHVADEQRTGSSFRYGDVKFSVDIGHNAHAFLLFQYDARSDQRFLSIASIILPRIDGGDAVRYALRTQHDGTVRLIFNFDFFCPATPY